MTRNALSRADVLRLLADTAVDDDPLWLDYLHFEFRQKIQRAWISSKSNSGTGSQDKPVPDRHELLADAPGPEDPVFWSVHTAQAFAEASNPEVSSVVSIPSSAQYSTSVPEASRLLSAAALENLFDQLSLTAGESHRLDVPSVCRQIAQNRPIQRLPRLAAQLNLGRWTLVLDRSNHLMPLWEAQDSVDEALRQRLPDEQYQRILLGNGPVGKNAPALVLGSQVLVLQSHLPSQANPWRHWLEQWRRRGHRCVSLSFLQSPSNYGLHCLMASVSRLYYPCERRVRRLRLALNAAGISCHLHEEMALWHHPHGGDISLGQWRMEPEHQTHWLQCFAALPESVQGIVEAECLQQRRALCPEAAAIEQMFGALIDREAEPDAEIFEFAVKDALAKPSGLAESWLLASLPAFSAVSSKFRQRESYQPLYQLASQLAIEKNLSLPAGVGLREQDEVWSLVQRGEQWMPRLSHEVGIPSIKLWESSGPWQSGQSKKLLEKNIGYSHEREIITPTHHLTLAPLTRPAWATSLWRDGSGLHAEHQQGTRLYLQEASEHFANSRWQMLTPGEGQPFGGDMGVDEYGLWALWAICGVVQRMRWIPPGEFLMGSPATEPERGGNETQHSVIISRGYWLADTACSQALWRAVMNENPSHFSGDDLPVEQVSWEDVQQFCQKLQPEVGENTVRLPTEAEWEYACRAGTQTAFSWGDELLPGKANYNGNRPYANGPQDEARGTTLDVMSFYRNPWGFYQMHGNVLEWCDDAMREYDTAQVVDPRDPQDDGRALRGGYWSGYGQWLRSAVRLAYAPDDRDHDIGFRFAVVPVPSAAGPQDLDQQSESALSDPGRVAEQRRGALRADSARGGLKGFFDKILRDKKEP